MDQALLDEALARLGLRPIGGTSTRPESERVAIVATRERGDIAIKSLRTGQGNTHLFEPRALSALANGGAPVPAPLAFEPGELTWSCGTHVVMAYQAIPGGSLDWPAEVDDETANAVAKVLRKIRGSAVAYRSSREDPRVDRSTDLVALQHFLVERPAFGETAVSQHALQRLADPAVQQRIVRTPHGLVHGNVDARHVLRDGSRLSGVVGFGGAYFGPVLDDIAIAVLTFSFDARERWRPDLFEAFLEPTVEWLRSNEVSFEDFHETLLAMCIRFGIRAGTAENRYFRSYESLSTHLGEPLRAVFA